MILKVIKRTVWSIALAFCFVCAVVGMAAMLPVACCHDNKAMLFSFVGAVGGTIGMLLLTPGTRNNIWKEIKKFYTRN
jgi:hypothetical protein